MLKSKSFIGCALAILLVIGGCSNYGGNTYTGSEAHMAQTVQHGTVLSIHSVAIKEKHAAAVGTVSGAVIGGVVGNMIGHGSGRTLATIGGALVGAGAGHVAGDAIGSQKGLEISVRLDDGREVSVVQGNDQTFAVGARVRVLTNSDGSSRVTN